MFTLLPRSPAARARFTITCRLLLSFFILGCAPSGSWAQVLYGISIGSTPANPSYLYTLNRQTGGATLVGSLGVGDLEGLAYDSDTDQLMAVGYDNNLYSINRNTGHATLVGLLGNGAFQVDGGELVVFPGLDYNSRTHALYLTTSPFYAAGQHLSELFRVDPATAAIVKIGDLPGNVVIDGLAYNPVTDVMYGLGGSDTLYAVNMSTAALTPLGTTFHITGFTEAAYDPASDTMWYTDSNLNLLYSRNMTTGAGALVGNTGVTEMRGLAFVPEPAISSFVAFGLAILAIRKRLIRP